MLRGSNTEPAEKLTLLNTATIGGIDQPAGQILLQSPLDDTVSDGGPAHVTLSRQEYEYLNKLRHKVIDTKQPNDLQDIVGDWEAVEHLIETPEPKSVMTNGRRPTARQRAAAQRAAAAVPPRGTGGPPQQRAQQFQRIRAQNPTTGRGRNVNAPALVSKIREVRTGHPIVKGGRWTADGRTCVAYREYLGDVHGSVDFATQQYPVNPGLATFNWLHNIAKEYDYYHFKALSFHYATDSATSAPGSVMLAVDFDAGDSGPTSKLEAMAFSNATRNATWENFWYDAKHHNMNAFTPHRFVRVGSVPTGEDVKTYDVGNLYVSTQGQTGTGIIGELYVEYEVEFSSPHFNLLNMSKAHTYDITGTTSLGPTSLLGLASAVTVNGGSLSVRYNSFHFNPEIQGYYVCHIRVTGTGLTQAGSIFAIDGGGNNTIEILFQDKFISTDSTLMTAKCYFIIRESNLSLDANGINPALTAGTVTSSDFTMYLAAR